MVHIGEKLHQWRLERILLRNPNVDLVGAPLVGRARRTHEFALEVGNVVGDDLGEHAGALVLSEVFHLLVDSAGAVCHCCGLV